MPIYYLPCPHCRGKIEVDTDYDSTVECESCDREFEWRWSGKGSLALRQEGIDPAFYYNGVGRFREWEEDEDYEDEEDNDDFDEEEDEDISINVRVKNSTSYELNIAVRYLDRLCEEWVSKGWFVFEQGEEARLPVDTENRYIYFFARDSESEHEWSGDYIFPIRGEECNFFRVFIKDGTKQFTQEFE